MAKRILAVYLAFRDPKVFLWILGLFIIISSLLHIVLGYDPDWGTTNLTLSIEASVAGAVLMMVAENSSRKQDEMARVQREQLAAILTIATTLQSTLSESSAAIKDMRDADRELLEELKKQWLSTASSSSTTSTTT